MNIRVFLTGLLVGLIFLISAMAWGEEKGLLLEISQEGNSVYGTVRNDTDKKIDALRAFGEWEFTTVLYYDGARWREAPLRHEDRPRLGFAEELSLAPGERLLSKIPALAKAGVTFQIDLSEYVLPKDLSRVHQIRMVTFQHWSNIIDFRKPEKINRDERLIDLSDPEKRMKE